MSPQSCSRGWAGNTSYTVQVSEYVWPIPGDEKGFKIWLTGWTVIGNSVCLCVCLYVCMWMHFAQLTDKMDPKYIIPSELAGFHDDEHPKNNMSTILVFNASNGWQNYLMSTDLHISGLILICWPLIGWNISGLMLICFNPQDPILTVQYLQTAPL